MKMLALVLIAAAGGFLSSCIAYEVPVADRDAPYYYRGGLIVPMKAGLSTAMATVTTMAFRIAATVPRTTRTATS
jgi:hypothetical protein